MNTPGPETRVFTSICDLPQKEQRYRCATGWSVSDPCIAVLRVNERMTVNLTLTACVNWPLTQSCHFRPAWLVRAALQLRQSMPSDPKDPALAVAVAEHRLA